MYIRWAERELSKIILLWIFVSQTKHNSGLTEGGFFSRKLLKLSQIPLTQKMAYGFKFHVSFKSNVGRFGKNVLLVVKQNRGRLDRLQLRNWKGDLFFSFFYQCDTLVRIFTCEILSCRWLLMKRRLNVTLILFLTVCFCMFRMT